MKNAFLFDLKGSFLSRVVQFFVIFSHHFYLVHIQKDNESGIIHDVMNWLAQIS